MNLIKYVRSKIIFDVRCQDKEKLGSPKWDSVIT